MMNQVTLAEQFPQVSFGTSGVRALVVDLTTAAVSSYIDAFVQRMRHSHALPDNAAIVVGMDLRPSSPGIATVVCRTLTLMGFRPEFLGALPTPALALRCASEVVPGVMVTGSHIPFDRNGIKFYSPSGEILKEDEQAISTSRITEDWSQKLSSHLALPTINSTAFESYRARYVNYFGRGCLAGWRIGVYEHSAVGRDLTKAVLNDLGATVIALGRSDEFVPVDTEAVSQDDIAQARLWCTEHGLDAVVSTDGDGDRPLMFDANGEFVRGDILGLICAQELGLKSLAVPVSCNTAIEKIRFFERVVRTRIGSPYVVQAMSELCGKGEVSVGGFEANGGFLLASDLSGLKALPTRDALLPLVVVLCAAATQKKSIAVMVEALPPRYTFSDRVKAIPTEYSRELLRRLLEESAFQRQLFSEKLSVDSIDTTDGIRFTFNDGEIAHIRPSGNAPELRCYAEASSIEAARELCMKTLGRVRGTFYS